MLVAPRKSKNYHRTISKDEPDADSQEDESETLEYFIEMFSGVIRLTEIYLKLTNYGCLFFDEFMAQVYCDMSNKRIENQRQPCIVVSNLNKFVDNSNVTSIITNKTDTLTGLVSLCSVLEEVYEIWFNYIATLRDKFACLNYFTISQIKYVYRHLNKLITDNSKNSKQSKQVETSFEFEVISSIMYNLSSNLTLKSIMDAYEKSLQISDQPNLVELEKFTIRNVETEIPSEKKRDVYDQSFYGQFKQTWNDFILEQNTLKSTKNKYLSFKQFILLLDLLNKSEKQNGKRHELKREIPGYLSNKG